MSAVNVYQVNCCANLFLLAPAPFKYFWTNIFLLHSSLLQQDMYNIQATGVGDSKSKIQISYNFSFHSLSQEYIYWCGEWYIKYYYFGNIVDVLLHLRWLQMWGQGWGGSVGSFSVCFAGLVMILQRIIMILMMITLTNIINFISQTVITEARKMRSIKRWEKRKPSFH